MKPIIRAAIDSGRPPLELLLDEPNRPRGKWDGKLIKALYLNEAFDIEGYPIWVEESPNVQFVARTKTIRSQQVVDSKRSKLKPGAHGVRVYAEAKLMPGKKWPTRKEWMSRDRVADNEMDADDLKAIQRAKEAEERAAAKVAKNPEVQRIVDEVKAKLKSRAGRLDE